MITDSEINQIERDVLTIVGDNELIRTDIMNYFSKKRYNKQIQEAVR